jgi:polyvinyl alcohol dehydrogenase (cytochrome)
MMNLRVTTAISWFVFTTAIFVSLPAPAAEESGEQLYKARCATCHEQAIERMPTRAALKEFAPENIIAAISTGIMSTQGSGLTPEQRRALAQFLSTKSFGDAQAATPLPNLCTKEALPLTLKGSQWNGWGNDLENTRVQPEPGFSAADVPRLKLKWAYGYPGRSTYGQPTVLGDRVFVTSIVGQVSSLDSATGCAQWIYDAGAGVKTALTIAPAPPGVDARYVAYFGDEKAFAHAINAETGKLIWRVRLDLHSSARITGTPKLHDGRLYVPLSSLEEGLSGNPKYECCTFRGSLSALEAGTGKLLWKSFTIAEEPKPFKKSSVDTQMYGPAGVSIWNSPTIDVKHNMIYVGTGNSYTDVPTTTHDAVMAFDLKTGERKWSKTLTPKDSFNTGCREGVGKNNCPKENGPDFDFGASIILKTLPNGKSILIAGQKSGVVYALDPENKGKIMWQTTVGAGSPLGGIEWGMAADSEQIYVAVSDILNFKEPMPGLTALKLTTGEKVWYVPTPAANCSFKGGRCVRAQSAAVTAITGVVFSGAFDGYMRAYSTKDGSLLWEFDTGQTFKTVNGITVSGGNIDGGGPTIANGKLFVNSGYGSWTGGFGRVMLVFEVER